MIAQTPAAHYGATQDAYITQTHDKPWFAKPGCGCTPYSKMPTSKYSLRRVY